MIRKSLLAVLAVLIAMPAMAQFMAPAASPAATVTQRIGLTDVTISYSRPGVKERTIWGDLVPYDKVWRTGANAATKIELSGDVKVNGQELKAGTYTIHTIPTASSWTIIFNSHVPASGYSYDEKSDVLRLEVAPTAHGFHERMMFAFPDVDEDSATLVLAWEKLVLSLKIENDTKKQVMDGAKATLDNWAPLYQAANYAYGNGMNEDAARWIDRSISIKATFFNTSLKARMLADAGKKKEAIALATKAVAMGKEAGNNTAATEKLIADWSK